MAQDINSSGIVYSASSLKTLLFGSLCFAVCAYAVYKLTAMGAPIDPIHGNRTMRAFIGIAGLSGILFLINFLILIKEDFCSIHLEQTKMTYRFLWLRHEWKWADIDQLHMVAPQPPSSLIAIFWLAIVMISKILPLGKTALKFEDIAYDEKRTRRWTLRPKKDGFVSIPLGYFKDPEEIGQEAERLHTAWYKRKNPEKA